VIVDLVRILRFLNLSANGYTLDEITIHTNTTNLSLLLEILVSMGFVRKSKQIDMLGKTVLRFLITSKGQKHISLDNQKITIPLSIIEEAIANYELTINRVLRNY
jgi:hypothetical protein